MDEINEIDYYEILGVARDADSDQIKKAWRRKCKIHHTDREGGDNEKIQKINSAYDTLYDSDRRAAYDRTGKDNFLTMQKAAHATIVGLAMQWLQNLGNNGDMIEWISANLQQQQANVIQNKINGTNILAHLNKALTKLHYSGSDKNLIADMIVQQVEGVNHQLNGADAQIEQINVALRILQSYKYDADAIFTMPTIRVFMGPARNPWG